MNNKIKVLAFFFMISTICFSQNEEKFDKTIRIEMRRLIEISYQGLLPFEFQQFVENSKVSVERYHRDGKIIKYVGSFDWFKSQRHMIVYEGENYFFIAEGCGTLVTIVLQSQKNSKNFGTDFTVEKYDCN